MSRKYRSNRHRPNDAIRVLDKASVNSQEICNAKKLNNGKNLTGLHYFVVDPCTSLLNGGDMSPSAPLQTMNILLNRFMNIRFYFHAFHTHFSFGQKLMDHWMKNVL